MVAMYKFMEAVAVGKCEGIVLYRTFFNLNFSMFLDYNSVTLFFS